MVHESLKHNNKNQEHLKVWEFGRIPWFRSALANNCKSNNLPLGQRVNVNTNKLYLLNICLVKNYFLGTGNKNFIGVNNALLEFEEEEEQMIEQRQSKNCLIILLSSKNLSGKPIHINHCHF